MSATPLRRQHPDDRPDPDPPAGPARPRACVRSGRPTAAAAAAAASRASRARLRAAVLLLVLLPCSVVAWAGHRRLYTAPIRFDDEGTYVSQALGRAAGRRPRAVHLLVRPPAARLDPAGRLVGRGPAPSRRAEPDRLRTPADAGRDVVSAAARVLLARRLGLARLGGRRRRPALRPQPAGVDYHRMVLLDNLAVPAAARGRSSSRCRRAVGSWPRSAPAGARRCGPRQGDGSARACRSCSGCSGARRSPATRRMSPDGLRLGFTPGRRCSYPLFALVKGELLPARTTSASGTPSPSSCPGARPAAASSTRAATRTASSPAGSTSTRTSRCGACSRRGRPRGATGASGGRGAAVLALMLLRPGYLPVPYVVALLPLAALVVAGVGDAVLRRSRCVTWSGARLRGWSAVAALLVLVVAVAALVLVAAARRAGVAAGDSILMTRDEDRPYRQASAWVERHVRRDEVLLVDNVTRTDLVEAGYPADPSCGSPSSTSTRPSSRRTPTGASSTTSCLIDHAHGRAGRPEPAEPPWSGPSRSPRSATAGTASSSGR